MSFEEYLVALLRPLGVYDLREGTINRGELSAYGVQLDSREAELDGTAREMNLTTAQDFGLEMIEALLPYRPVCETAAQRRAALAALLRIGGALPPRPSTTPCGGAASTSGRRKGAGPGMSRCISPMWRGFPRALMSCAASLRRSCPAMWM